MRRHPEVPRHWLFAIAGLVWTVVGLILCWRAVIWLAPFAVSIELSLELFGVILALIGYVLGFSKIVRINIDRIHRMPDRVLAFSFTGMRGYLMIAIMVVVGITLRNSSIPKYYLSVPYIAMGGALLIGSVQFYRQFLVVSSRKDRL